MHLCLWVKSKQDPFYDSETYRSQGGDGTVHWYYDKVSTHASLHGVCMNYEESKQLLAFPQITLLISCAMFVHWHAARGPGGVCEGGAAAGGAARGD